MRQSAARAWSLIGLCALLSTNAARAQPPLPAGVKARIAALAAECVAAGGRPGRTPFVKAQDFSGDGRLDYLISAGDFECAGQPALFRRGGQAEVEIHVTDASGQSRRLFHDTLIAYRLLDGRPVRVQIARTGEACGAGSAARTQCGDELAWNGNGFDLVPTGSRAAPGKPAERPGDAVAAATADALAVQPNAEAGFIAGCRKDILSGNPQAGDWVDGHCRDAWGKVSASAALVDALLAAVPVEAGRRTSASALKARLPQVRWAARPEGRTATSGRLGKLAVIAEGTPNVDTLSLGWQETGADIPYDVEGALRARGVRPDLVACQSFGAGEQTRVFAVRAAGRAPFGLTIHARGAPTANAWSMYSASADLGGALPTLRSVQTRDRDGGWSARCD